MIGKSATAALLFSAATALSLGQTGSAQAQASDQYLGQLMAVGFNFCPRGWASADGQLLAISTNTALFSLLGTTYGGDGQVTFALPDLRGRSIVHPGQGPGLSPISLGERSGQESVALLPTQLPIHTHSATSVLAASENSADKTTPENNVLATAKTYAAGPAQIRLNSTSVTTTIAPSGGGQPIAIRDPYLSVRWCIATQGVFPSRP